MQVAINHIAAACAAVEVKHAIICPGSRNAPLTMAFSRHPSIECHSVVDERSAGFIALGIAQQTQQPVVLLCTSGSAVVNFYPAVVEAFYQRIPLLIITADRPPEMIDQWDGQTMHQNEIFGKHVKVSYTLPDDYSVPEIFSQTTIQAYKDCIEGINGPVHINVPLREPLYDAKRDAFEYPNVNAKLRTENKTNVNTLALEEVFRAIDKVLIFNGANGKAYFSPDLLKDIENKAVILSDAVSNQHTAGNIKYWDFLLSKKEILEGLVPDVLITTGTSTVSKNLKLFLRKYKPKHHFHISPTGDIADPFQTNPYLIKGEVQTVLSKLNWGDKNNNYQSLWQRWDSKITTATTSYFSNIQFGEFSAVNKVLANLPKVSYLQLSNSMGVRWANLLGITKELKKVNSNRGVSGIDGCTSTAVGASFIVDDTMTLITGDVAFFYDSNALWNKFAPANLRIIILNNGGGGIFRLIEGPQQMVELGKFLETQHQRDAELLAKDMNVDYASASNYNELAKELESFYNPSNKPKILEVFTKAAINTKIFNEYKQLIHGLE